MAANHNLGGIARNYAQPYYAGSDMSGPNSGLNLLQPNPLPGQYFGNDVLSPASNGGAMAGGNIMVSHNVSGPPSYQKLSKNASKDRLSDRRHPSTIPASNGDLSLGASAVRQENLRRAQQIE